MENEEINIGELMHSIAEDEIPQRVALFIGSQLILKPSGALYAKWDEATQEAIWYYSSDKKAIFELPDQCEVVYIQRACAMFRSVVFRLSGWVVPHSDRIPRCGDCIVSSVVDGKTIRRRLFIHGSFLPEHGVWIKIISECHMETEQTSSADPRASGCTS